MAKNKKEKKSKFSFKKTLFPLAMGGIILATPFMFAGCSSGQNGVDGAKWYSGVNYSTDTKAQNAKAGDFYIDTDDYILYQKNSDGTWALVMENFGKSGNDGQQGLTGKKVELRKGDTAIEWRYEGDSEWNTLVSLSTLVGATGTTPEIKNGNWFIGDQDTGFKAVATDGNDGVTPHIDQTSGNWFIGTKDTGVKAKATDGKNGNDAKEVEIATNDGVVQWRYKTGDDTSWKDLVTISTLEGEDGTNGKSVKIALNSGKIQWRYTDDSNEWTDIIAVSELKGADGVTPHIDQTSGNWFIGTQDTGVKAIGRDIELQTTATAIQWRYTSGTDTEWKDLISLSAIKGATGEAGKSVKIAINGGKIQWRYTDDSNEWVDVIAVSELKGSDGVTPSVGADGYWYFGTEKSEYKAVGVDGREISLQAGDTHIQWKYEGDENWTNLIPIASLKGADGATWLNGTEVSLDNLTASVGKIGDFYLNTSNYDIFKKGTEAWEKIGNIRGEQGTDGKGIVSITNRYDYNAEGKLCLVMTITYTQGEPEEIWTVVPARVNYFNIEGADTYNLTYEVSSQSETIENVTLSVYYDDGTQEYVPLTKDMIFDGNTGDAIDFTQKTVYENVVIKYNGHTDGSSRRLTVYSNEDLSVSSARAINTENGSSYLRVYQETPTELTLAVNYDVATGGSITKYDNIVLADCLNTDYGELPTDFFTTAGYKSFAINYQDIVIDVDIELYDPSVSNIRYYNIDSVQGLMVSVNQSDYQDVLTQQLVGRNLNVEYYEEVNGSTYDSFSIESSHIDFSGMDVTQVGITSLNITSPDNGNVISIPVTVTPDASSAIASYNFVDGTVPYESVTLYENGVALLTGYDSNEFVTYEVLSSEPDYTTAGATIDVKVTMYEDPYYYTLINGETPDGNSIVSTEFTGEPTKVYTSMIDMDGDGTLDTPMNIAVYENNKAMMYVDMPTGEGSETMKMVMFSFEIKSDKSFSIMNFVSGQLVDANPEEPESTDTFTYVMNQ